MSEPTPAFISTTIPYVNARPHLGHSFEFVETDAYARYLRMIGRDVFFLSGSDENSLKNVLAAEREKIPVRELVDRNASIFEGLKPALDLSYDYFIRTSVDPLHLKGATAFWERMAERGDLFRKLYRGLYCVDCEQFYVEEELVQGRCPEHRTEPEIVDEENWFFRLSRYQEPLREVLESRKLNIVPETRRNEILSFVRGGLIDISVSRSAERARGWGIPVPGDPGQVMYVWMDALTNYVNALQWPDNGAAYRRWWQEAGSRIHVVGKGVTRFHAVYWPAMLMSVDLPLPTVIVSHGYLTMEGQKLSKSLGNVVDPEDLIARYGRDPLRYFLLAEFPPFSDGDFSESRLAHRYNADLANGLGNLMSRITSMLGNFRAGIVPSSHEPQEVDVGLSDSAAQATVGVKEAMEQYDHRRALQHLWELVRRTNAYIADTAPWRLHEAATAGDTSSDARLDTVLFQLAAAARCIGACLYPFLPTASLRIRRAFGSTDEMPDLEEQWGHGLAGASVQVLKGMFPRLDIIPA